MFRLGSTKLHVEVYHADGRFDDTLFKMAFGSV